LLKKTEEEESVKRGALKESNQAVKEAEAKTQQLTTMVESAGQKEAELRLKERELAERIEQANKKLAEIEQRAKDAEIAALEQEILAELDAQTQELLNAAREDEEQQEEA